MYTWPTGQTRAHKETGELPWISRGHIFLWKVSVPELEAFQVYINSLIPGIKVTLNHRYTNIEFLDTMVYKKWNHNGTATLQTKVFLRTQISTNFHPRHTVKATLKSQLIRFRRICSTKADYVEACNNSLKFWDIEATAERCTSNSAVAPGRLISN